jgi:hypothetical protein
VEEGELGVVGGSERAVVDVAPPVAAERVGAAGHLPRHPVPVPKAVLLGEARKPRVMNIDERSSRARDQGGSVSSPLAALAGRRKSTGGDGLVRLED